MSNSSLVSYTKLSPNCNKPRKSKIDKITIHHFAGCGTIEACGELFADPKRKASSNYAVGTDGRVAMYVEEKNRAWTSSNAANDHRAVTIEVANDSGAPDWHVSAKALEATIALCVDICQRNGIAALNFTGDKTGNLTMHKYFAATNCPGPYLESKFPYIAAEVNRRLLAAKDLTLYRILLGPYRVKANADAQLAKLKAKGFVGAYIEQTTDQTAAPVDPVKPTPAAPYKVGDRVKLTSDATVYGTTNRFQKWVYSSTLYVRGVSGDRIVISTIQTGAVTGAVHKKHLVRA